MIRAHDGAMTGLGPHSRPRPRLRSRTGGLLVCALLLGLLGMHGLGSVPRPHAPAGHDHAAASAHTGAEAPARLSMPGACGHDADGGVGHLNHADPTCASASVGQPPVVVPALVPDVVAPAEPTDARVSLAGSAPDGGRAPPSLSELQLLRI